MTTNGEIADKENHFTSWVDNEESPRVYYISIPVGNLSGQGLIGLALVRGMLDNYKNIVMRLMERLQESKEGPKLKLIVPQGTTPLGPKVVA